MSCRQTSYGCTEFRILPKWKEGHRDSQFDYGIILPSKPGGFGNYQSLPLLGLSDTVIQLWMKEQTKTYLAGWPTDKQLGTLWESPGKFKSYDPYCVSCASDTWGGQSGGPLYAIGEKGPVVVGVHVKDDGSSNGARRIDETMIAQIEWWYNDWNKGANAKVVRY
jgi:glutamyl endopeptidase